jgi:hypothetical protein
MTAMEDAAQLRGAGQQAYEGILGGNNQVDTDLGTIGQTLQGIRTTAEESTSAAAGILGEDHPSMASIVGAAAGVVEAIENIMGILSSIEMEMSTVQGAAANLSAAFDTAANGLASGG